MNMRNLFLLALALLLPASKAVGQNITIVSQPVGRIASEGSPIGYTVQAVPGVPGQTLSYRWERTDGAAMPVGSFGINSNTVTLGAVTNALGVYRCVITNISGSITSAPAGLFVNQGGPSFSVPTVVVSPFSQTVTQGSTVFLTASAYGVGPLRLQWRGRTNIATSQLFDNVAGATNASLVISNIQDSGAYLLRLDNANGAVGSAVANITVLRTPTVISNPVNRAVVIGGTATFSAVIDGGQLNYQWLKNGSPISTQTNSALTFTVTNVSNGGGYSLVGSNSFGSVTSAVAQLTVVLAPTLVNGPANVSVPATGSASFSATASGTSPLTLEWFVNGNLVQSTAGTGASQLTLSSLLTNGVLIAGLSTNVSAPVMFRASNAAGSVSSSATILVTAGPVAPVITLQPSATNLLVGQTLSLAGAATGTSPLFYQWNFTGTNLVGETNPTLTRVSMGFTNAGLYNLVVTNQYGSTSSVSVVVNVFAVTNREVRISGITPAVGNAISVPLSLRGLGGESTVDFTLAYRGFFINGLSVAVPSGSAVTNVVRDASAANSGVLGLHLDLDTNITAVAGDRPLVTLMFTSSSQVPSYLLNFAFTNAPHAQGVVAGTNVTTDWVVAPFAPPATVGTNILGQSGLFQQSVEIYNPSASSVASARVYVGGLTNDTKGNPIRLYNASGTENGVPYIEFGPIGGSSSTLLTLEYYVSDRVTTPAPLISVVFGSGTFAEVTNFTTVTVDRALYTNKVFIVEFLTKSNRTHYVQYSGDANSTNWTTSFPGVVGTGSRMQWIDNGPPRTATPPTNGTRFYRVVTPQ